MTVRRSALAVRLGSWLLASSIAAELAHAAIEQSERLGFGSVDYEAHEHASVGVVAFAALVFGATALLAAVLPRLQSGAFECVLASRRPRLAAVFLGCLGMLVCMEFCEQIAAFGHIDGVRAALGGNVGAGLSAIAVASTCVHRLGMWLCSPIVRTAANAAGALAGWIARCEPTRLRAMPAAIVRRSRSRAWVAPPRMSFARGLGLRAPPTLV